MIGRLHRPRPFLSEASEGFVETKQLCARPYSRSDDGRSSLVLQKVPLRHVEIGWIGLRGDYEAARKFRQDVGGRIADVDAAIKDELGVPAALFICRLLLSLAARFPRDIFEPTKEGSDFAPWYTKSGFLRHRAELPAGMVKLTKFSRVLHGLGALI